MPKEYQFAAFVCPDCSVTFATLSHLQAHWLQDHRKQTTVWQQCADIGYSDTIPQDRVDENALQRVRDVGLHPSHSFRSKTFRKTQRCDLCQQPVRDEGASCKACKYSCHLHCEPKVISSCEPKQGYELNHNENREYRPSRRSSPGSRSLERKTSPKRSLERQPSFIMDITYVTEKIIVVTFPESGIDSTYRNNLKEVTHMLRTKHGSKYMVFNLSERRHDLSKLNSQVMEFGWPAHLSPPLERLCSICKSLDSWFRTDSQNVAVLHSKGDKGRIGVVLAAYLHYTSMCASDDKALDRFTMKRFFDDKLYYTMHPSQKRYINYFAELLSGNIKMNSSAPYLHHLILNGIPNFDNKGGCKPFFKIYQGMQPVYTSGVYLATDSSKRVIVSMEPSLQLRGDILIKCYHKKQRPAGRSPIFRLQFHTCTLAGDRVTFTKTDLDDACIDSRFPDDGKIELQFSQRPGDYRGNGSVNDTAMSVDRDPLIKQNSYENFDMAADDSQSDIDDFLESFHVPVSHAEGPLDGNLYATIAKKRAPVTESCRQPQTLHDNTSDVDGPHTISMDSGISSSSGIQVGYGNPSPSGASNPGHPHLSNGTTNGHTSPGTVEVEVHHSPRHNPGHKNPTKTKSRAVQRLNSSELDDLLDGMLREIQSIPDVPVSSRYGTLPRNYGSSPSSTPYTYTTRTSEYPRSGGGQVTTVTTTYRWQDGEDEVDTPFHSREGAQPFTYLDSASPPLRRRAHSESGVELEGLGRHDEGHLGTYRHSSVSPETNGGGSWLQKQQQKLRARREGSWDDRQRRLIAELRTTTAHRSPEPPIDVTDGILATSDHPSSREHSPLKTHNYSTPLHVHTLSTYTQSKPPVHRGLSAPTSPIIPSRTSSKDVTLRRYPQWQQQPVGSTMPVVRQNSDTSFDRERPFVAAKRSHQQARDEVSSGGTSPHHIIASSVVYGYPYCPKKKDANGLASDKAPKPEEVTQSPSHSPQYIGHSPVAQSTPNRPEDTTDNAGFWSPSAHDGINSPPGTGDRPATPAFPVPPRTPYMNHDSLSGLPPKSPTLSRRRDRSPSPSTLTALQQSLPSSAPMSPTGQSSPSVYFGQSQRSSMVSLSDPGEVISHHPVFVKDTSKYWYKPNISREEAISVLKNKPPGTFIVRDSNSFPGAFGLAVKVATLPANVQHKAGDPSSELVRHFLIEPTAKGVRLKGCANESVYGSLSALVYQHSITPLALPCRLLLPESELGADSNISASTTDNKSVASSLLQQGAACSVLYLCTMDMESLTGPQAVRRAMSELLAIQPAPVPTVVHFKVSSMGITLTDNNRKLFFRRHYALNAISYCGTDPEDRRWTQKNDDSGVTVTLRCFGFVARKPASRTDNQCHLFAEVDPEQPASAIVNFVAKVMDAAGMSAKASMI
ncbi:tensin-1-like isoform X4 [Ornithodoros turicata]|uniref:tensin-1-like isoform X4 n=1 Tax=Ornithodoros turicata TaxID=34597 RepID=UPI003138F2A6